MCGFDYMKGSRGGEGGGLLQGQLYIYTLASCPCQSEENQCTCVGVAGMIPVGGMLAPHLTCRLRSIGSIDCRLCQLDQLGVVTQLAGSTKSAAMDGGC